MTISPDRRLLVLAASCVAGAALSVLAPSLWPAVLVAAGLIFVSTLADGVMLLRNPALEIVRVVPERAAVGRETQIELRLFNPAGTPVELELFDEVAVDLSRGDPHFPTLTVGAGETSSFPYRIRPRERGDRPFGLAAALVRSPLGLLRRRVLSQPGTLRVLPDASRFLRPEALDVRQLLAAIGVKVAAPRGDGMDFDSLRDYVPGDDPRRVDWRATGRRGKLVIRQYRHEESHRVVVVLDSSRLMGARGKSTQEGPGRSKLDHCIDATLALLYAALSTGDRAGLAVFDRELHTSIAPRSRRAEFGLFVDALATVEARLVEPDYRRMVRGLMAQGGGRSLFVILTDFAATPPAELHGPLATLAKKHRVLVVAVRDPIFEELSAEDEDGDDALYRRIVLDDLQREREVSLAQLRRDGIRVLDLAHGEITAPVLNGYLTIRSEV